MISATLVIIAINVLVSVACFNNRSLFEQLLFSPYHLKHARQYYRLLTHAFVHGSYMHLFVNMFVLYSFGSGVEALFGLYFGNISTLYFLILYLGGVLVACLPSLQKYADIPAYRSVGASGAVAAVLFSYILIKPTAMLGVMLVIPMPAFLFGIVYMWYESKMQGRNDGIAHDAHLFGALFGLLFTGLMRPEFGPEFFSQITRFISSFLS
jgi:membrane associated rhomboid family serine protease